jgi:hypothetical protein
VRWNPRFIVAVPGDLGSFDGRPEPCFLRQVRMPGHEHEPNRCTPHAIGALSGLAFGLWLVDLSGRSLTEAWIALTLVLRHGDEQIH